MSAQETQSPWWGDYELELDESARWQIGPLSFWLYRGGSEWRLSHEWADGEAAADWNVRRRSAPPEDRVETERFAVRETEPSIHLRPLPADRSVVARPKTPFRVMPGESSRVFISSPLWVGIGTGGEALALRELPARRLSDTWFGSTTRDGELCYALKTNARTSLEQLPRVAYRLVTPVVIDNRAESPLLVERLSLPVPFLSIYGTEHGDAWSEEVRMLHTEDNNMAELDVRQGPPAEARGAARSSEPRRLAEEGHLFRAFGSLLGFDL